MVYVVKMRNHLLSLMVLCVDWVTTGQLGSPSAACDIGRNCSHLGLIWLEYPSLVPWRGRLAIRAQLGWHASLLS